MIAANDANDFIKNVFGVCSISTFNVESGLDSAGSTPKKANFAFDKNFENTSFGVSSPYRLGWS